MSDSLKNDSCPKPKSLKLAFAKAADNARICRVLDPKVKGVVDPHGHVEKRLNAAFDRAVAGGTAAMLLDEAGAVVALTMNYHVHVDKNPPAGAPHDHTNSGTTLSLMPGYKSSAVVVSALALDEWLNHPPLQTLSAGIVPDNAPSLKIYADTLGWEKSEDPALLPSIMTATWRTLPDPADPTGNTCLEAPPPTLESVGWYICGDKALIWQARVLLDCLDRGGVVSKETGHVIPVDCSALDKAGLSRKRLTAIASGMTSRKEVLKMAA